MKKILKITAIVLVLGLIVIQFIRPERNASAAAGLSISSAFPVPSEVDQVIRASCYDCHSNTTRYPWYSEVQPVGWWLAADIQDAKAELNFDEFAGRRPRWQFRKFVEVEEQITKDEMPLPAYTILHRNAILSPEQKSLVINWTLAMRDSMKAHFPADSLERRRPPR